MRDLFELLDNVDLTLTRAAAVLPEARLAPLASRAESLRSKRGYVGDVLVLDAEFAQMSGNFEISRQVSHGLHGRTGCFAC